jgi:hypothetical protein
LTTNPRKCLKEIGYRGIDQRTDQSLGHVALMLVDQLRDYATFMAARFGRASSVSPTR